MNHETSSEPHILWLKHLWIKTNKSSTLQLQPENDSAPAVGFCSNFAAPHLPFVRISQGSLETGGSSYSWKIVQTHVWYRLIKNILEHVGLMKFAWWRFVAFCCCPEHSEYHSAPCPNQSVCDQRCARRVSSDMWKHNGSSAIYHNDLKIDELLSATVNCKKFSAVAYRTISRKVGRSSHWVKSTAIEKLRWYLVDCIFIYP